MGRPHPRILMCPPDYYGIEYEINPWMKVARGADRSAAAHRAHGKPQHIRSDNGTEFVAKGIRAWITAEGLETRYIAPGAPWENGYVESFNSKVRDELLNLEEFGSVLEAKVLAKDWKQNYNHERPHHSLGYLTPAEFAATAPRVGCAPLRPPETQDGKTGCDG